MITKLKKVEDDEEGTLPGPYVYLGTGLVAEYNKKEVWRDGRR
jgi:hypothetical protein